MSNGQEKRDGTLVSVCIDKIGYDIALYGTAVRRHVYIVRGGEWRAKGDWTIGTGGFVVESAGGIEAPCRDAEK